MGVMGERPTGTVTFVFTDIEGSTALLDRLGDDYGEVLFAHQVLLRGVWEAHGGVEVSTEGDAFFVAFSSASRAVAATAAGQEALAAQAWPHGDAVRVRMGVHTGEPRMHKGEYWGPDVHYAARIASAARGGQVLVSATTAALASGAELTSLGRHRLKDFPEPRELFALGRGPHPAPKTLDPLRTNLPSAPSPLVGRENEVEELMALLLDEARLVTVLGAGGTGKTRLALAVADGLLDQLADGAFLVELAELSSPDEVLGAIASVVGTTADLLAGTVAGRELLLILDNFEHVLDAAPALAELLVAAPGVRILVTSQAPLRLAEEHTYGLAGLAETPATELLIARAKRASRAFGVDEAGAAAVAALCRELEGSPLGIELAAARLALLPPKELLERLRHSPDALGTGARNLPERQRGLRAAMRWSYGLLDPQAATLFRRIGHFTGEATLERIEQVCGAGIDDVLESLAQLVDTSLVRRTCDGRFEVASALRTYSRELLEASNERDALCRRHAEVVVAEWLPLWIDRPMIAYRETYGPIVAEQSDLAVLLDWSAQSDAELFSQLIACAYGPLSNSLGPGRMQRWHEAIEQASATGPATGRLRALVRGLTADELFRPHRSRPHRTALDLALEADTEGDPIFAAWLYGSAVVLDTLHRPGQAWQARAQTVADELRSSPNAEVRDLAAIVDAHLLLLQDRFDEAADAFEAAIRRAGKTWAAETPLYMVGDCHLFAGRPKAALAAYARGLTDARDKPARMDMGFQGDGIVAALIDLGRHEEALEALGACDSLNGEDVLPRERNSFWGSVMAGRLASARAALGAQDADAAYARGRALGIEEVLELLLSYGGQVGAAP
jgi:predicted ATPase/tetratricopeptide (TPR) repeat protein